MSPRHTLAFVPSRLLSPPLRSFLHSFIHTWLAHVSAWPLLAIPPSKLVWKHWSRGALGAVCAMISFPSFLPSFLPFGPHISAPMTESERPACLPAGWLVGGSPTFSLGLLGWSGGRGSNGREDIENEKTTGPCRVKSYGGIEHAPRQGGCERRRQENRYLPVKGELLLFEQVKPRWL